MEHLRRSPSALGYRSPPRRAAVSAGPLPSAPRSRRYLRRSALPCSSLLCSLPPPSLDSLGRRSPSVRGCCSRRRPAAPLRAGLLLPPAAHLHAVHLLLLCSRQPLPSARGCCSRRPLPSVPCTCTCCCSAPAGGRGGRGDGRRRKKERNPIGVSG